MEFLLLPVCRLRGNIVVMAALQYPTVLLCRPRLLYILEITLYLILTQVMLYLRAGVLGLKETNLLKREIGTELVSHYPHLPLGFVFIYLLISLMISVFQIKCRQLTNITTGYTIHLLSNI